MTDAPATGPAASDRLYYDHQQMLDFAAEVTDIRLESRHDGINRWQIALDRTAFYPESGGQPWDLGHLEAVAKSGTRLHVPVLAVVEDGEEVWHLVEKPLSAGTKVRGYIDGARRRDHMQQHTGQHLLSAVFLKELGAATVSFHLGVESSTIDLASDPLTREDLIRVEQTVNALAAEDRQVSVSTVTLAEAQAMLARGDLRKLPERHGPIRVVQIEGVEWNACGGTHVASTARIGAIGLRRVERVKQATRIEFCCGLRMVEAARHDFDLATEMGRILSTGPKEIAGKVAGMLESARAAAKARKTLLEDLAAMEVQTFAAKGRRLESPARDPEYAKLLAAKFVQLRQDGVALTWSGGTIVLASGTTAAVDCGAVMKTALAQIGARGGGSTGLAQGGVAPEQAEQICELIRLQLHPA